MEIALIGEKAPVIFIPSSTESLVSLPSQVCMY